MVFLYICWRQLNQHIYRHQVKMPVVNVAWTWYRIMPVTMKALNGRLHRKPPYSAENECVLPTSFFALAGQDVAKMLNSQILDSVVTQKTLSAFRQYTWIYCPVPRSFTIFTGIRCIIIAPSAVQLFSPDRLTIWLQYCIVCQILSCWIPKSHCVKDTQWHRLLRDKCYLYDNSKLGTPTCHTW